MSNSFPLLTICVPTYNRCNLLDMMLGRLCPICQKLCIPVFVSDNCSSDDTPAVLEKYSKLYNLNYIIQKNNIGPDCNFEYLLTNVKSQYIWMVSDSSELDEKELAALLSHINHHSYDFIITGAVHRTEQYKDEELYRDANQMLNEIGWHMTYLSTLIYNSNVIKFLDFNRFYDSNFLQTGVIFEYLSGKGREVNCLFYNQLKIRLLKGEKNGHWRNEALYIFCQRWYLFIMSLPLSYKYENKRQCIIDHGIKSNLFTHKGLLSLRADKAITIKKYCENYFFVVNCIKYKYFCLFACFLPVQILKSLKNIVKKVRNV